MQNSLKTNDATNLISIKLKPLIIYSVFMLPINIHREKSPTLQDKISRYSHKEDFLKEYFQRQAAYEWLIIPCLTHPIDSSFDEYVVC